MEYIIRKSVFLKEFVEGVDLMAAMLQNEIEQYRRTLDIKKDQKRYRFIMRGVDIFLSFIGLIFVSPIMLITALAIKLESPGPIIYKQIRCGQFGKEFILYKFRSMRKDAESGTGAVWAQRNDPRVTRVGSFIRKTRIDELPQLVNIIRGDMSLVGPRPERPELIEKFERETPGFKRRMLVKPGLTGLAQVEGGYELTPDEKAKMDEEYILNRSIGLDFKIIIKTVGVVLTGYGAR